MLMLIPYTIKCIFRQWNLVPNPTYLQRFANIIEPLHEQFTLFLIPIVPVGIHLPSQITNIFCEGPLDAPQSDAAEFCLWVDKTGTSRIVTKKC